jgi:small subunit ribosomal protein S21|tara:strand:+ start:556 stop:816 length:261 start_codon:yes stop_codon:yes gene_type:complete
LSNHNSKKPNPNYNRSDVSLQGTRVEVRNNDVTKAMRKFKRKVQEDGILQEYRERQYFEKPSLVRKKAKAAARSRWLKKLSKLNDN